ncbi:C4-dicarboxylate ABC transporter substrate-binding protein [Erythrobacter longus]|uniref:TRAP transporter small permease protein n=1 Tax=Erythrobacter longus TaxID=1044 RepID=A0A074MAX6_ERYLO|nr:TRAP transporter small permease [Erythrobacter longus]KEO90554.1 C4-dicarboxylate ABC transporter substrate-binding protein [Erythrobacter longus]
MQRISDFLIKLGAAGLVLMTAIIGWQVFGRFVLNDSPSWSEQAALILMIWYVFFAAAAGVYEGFHIRIALLENSLSEGRARMVRRVIHALVAGGGTVLLVYGAQLVWLVRDHVVPALGISRGFAYIPVPVCGLLIAVFAALHFVREGESAGAGEGKTTESEDI